MQSTLVGDNPIENKAKKMKAEPGWACLWIWHSTVT